MNIPEYVAFDDLIKVAREFHDIAIDLMEKDNKELEKTQNLLWDARTDLELVGERLFCLERRVAMLGMAVLEIAARLEK